VLDCIELRIAEPLRIRHLAQEAAIFGRHVGVTPKTYRISQQTRRAQAEAEATRDVTA
jgi:hypothetical protein